MTATMSFRVDDSIVRALDAEAARCGSTKSELMVRAVKELLYRLACERDAEAYLRQPLTDAEIAAWPNEHWIDDAPGTDWSEIFGS